MFQLFRATIVSFGLVMVCYGGNHPTYFTGHKQVEGNSSVEMQFSIAFSTFMSTNTHLKINQTVIFDQLLLNDRHGYDPATGIFRAPIDGVYMFEFSFVVPPKQYFGCYLLVDEGVISSVLIDAFNTRSYVQGGNSAIARVSKGQQVRVQNRLQDTTIMSSLLMGYSAFSGFLLYVA